MARGHIIIMAMVKWVVGGGGRADTPRTCYGTISTIQITLPEASTAIIGTYSQMAVDSAASCN